MVIHNKSRNIFCVLLSFFIFGGLGAQESNGINTNSKSIAQNNGQNKRKILGTITFDQSNIKQYWVDKTVLSNNGMIEILLQKKTDKGKKSIPYPVQFANINESMDCTVEISTDTTDADLVITGADGSILSHAEKVKVFTHLNTLRADVHMDAESIMNNTINYVFSSSDSDTIKIYEIRMSFYENPESKYLFNHGRLNITSKDVVIEDGDISENKDGLVLTGKRSLLISNKNIVPSDKPIHVSFKIKNLGPANTRLLAGFAGFTNNKVKLNAYHYPYQKDSRTLHVLAAERGSKKIVVDGVPDGVEWCYIALDAKDDFSDVPSFNLIHYSIEKIVEIPNGHAEIYFHSPLEKELSIGTAVRVHGASQPFAYCIKESIKVGETKEFIFEINNKESITFSHEEGLPRGMYYIKPAIHYSSLDVNEECKIEISDFIIDY